MTDLPRTYFEIVFAEGTVNLGERGEHRNGIYNVTHLLDDATTDTINFEMSFDEDGELTIEMGAYHVENAETKRAFHPRLRARISREHLKALHGYIKFFLDYFPLDDGDTESPKEETA